MTSAGLRFFARWHAWRTRPRKCVSCGVSIPSPADGVRLESGGPAQFCGPDCRGRWVQTMQEW